MSSPSVSRRPLEPEKEQQSDVVHQDYNSDPQISVDPETLGQNKSDQEILPVDNPERPEEEDGEEEEAEDLEEKAVNSAGLPQLISGSSKSAVTTLPLSSPNPDPWRVANKWKKGKGKGKPNTKKQQMFEKKFQSLMKNLNPIPFVPFKLLDFEKHENLFRKLGLWDFIHTDFDKHLRKDLIAQLVASYETQSRGSYVNGYRVGVNRADLARAFKIPLKKDKGNVGGVVQMDIDIEPQTEESVRFLVQFVSDWVLRHGDDDMWLMPSEVMNWIQVVKDGEPEKVDWAGFIWFMVEKELVQGGNLRNCYYASHLQHLMKEQKVFLREEADGIAVESNEEAKEVEEDVDEVYEKVDDPVKCLGEENGEMGGPSVELTLGQDNEKEGSKDAEVMDFENCKEGSDGEPANEQGQWLTHGKNDMGDHFMQHCSLEYGRVSGDTEDSKVEEEKEEKEEEDAEYVEEEEETCDKFNIFPKDALEGDGFTGNLLQVMEANQMAYGTHMQQMESGPSFMNESGKRVLEHESVIFDHPFDDNNKRLRINGPSDPKPVDFGTCMENAQQMMEKARVFYLEKEHALEQTNMNTQILLSELEKRDDMIELLRKSRLEKDNEIYRYERELYLMGNVLEGYRKALKDTQKKFDEYRQRAHLPEEPTYKVVGHGGLMLSTGEIESIRRKQEEEFEMNCLLVEQKMREVEKVFASQFDASLEKVHMLNERLAGLEAHGKELLGVYAKRKVLLTEERVPAVAEPPASEEEVAEVAEPPSNEKKVPEVAEPPASKEKVAEVAEAPASEEKVSEVAEPPADE